MKISLNDPRVNAAIDFVKTKHSVSNIHELEKAMEDYYHCKIVYEDAPAYVNGHIEILDEIYESWFVLRFGVGNE